jgi:hypothetical protein
MYLPPQPTPKTPLPHRNRANPNYLPLQCSRSHSSPLLLNSIITTLCPFEPPKYLLLFKSRFVPAVVEGGLGNAGSRGRELDNLKLYAFYWDGL